MPLCFSDKNLSFLPSLSLKTFSVHYGYDIISQNSRERPLLRRNRDPVYVYLWSLSSTCCARSLCHFARVGAWPKAWLTFLTIFYNNLDQFRYSFGCKVYLFSELKRAKFYIQGNSIISTFND